MEGEEICELCFKTITDSNFVTMDDGKKDMLLYVIPYNIFKTFCFDHRDIKDLESNETAFMLWKSKYKCPLCWTFLEINAPDEVESEQLSLELMMKECLPDLNVNLKDNSTLCEKCSTSLRNIFDFNRRCLESAEKMKSVVFLNPEHKDQASLYEAHFFLKIENTDTYSEEAVTVKDHISPISVFKIELEEQEDDEFEELTGRNDAQLKTEVIEKRRKYNKN
ncbi:hypothetical protein NQ314_016020 [Rhamnusium bicolor]|uniref:ZAD domain-containing protein n=1 Tax=Rhamnusium bicolor TaxID=1586634 RepID=A0AAV8WZQ6_9CUCU|nr:hypothetical protein NQ314_016020 [Rhamnusium bicolor]